MRIRYRKGEAIKYISHLDLLRAWERAIRRSGLPLAYSLGFSPHPKITVALPLAVGCTGENEIVDVLLEEPIPEEEMLRALAPALPEGLSVTSAKEVALRSPALTTLFVQAVYEILLVDVEPQEVGRRITELLRQEKVPVEFRRKQFDLRPLIGSCTVSTPRRKQTGPEGRQVNLRAVLLRDERGRIGRPDVLLQALGLSEYARQIHRAQVVYREP
jgi:radical SAM-linked protein